VVSKALDARRDEKVTLTGSLEVGTFTKSLVTWKL
jgi:hypothetical protein